MRIAVISDAVMPTPYEYGHGLGRAAWHVAQGLQNNGQEVTLLGGEGSRLTGGSVHTVPLRSISQEHVLIDLALRLQNNFDVAVDMSHSHGFALQSHIPTIAYFQDRESAKAPNAVFVSFDLMNHIGLPGHILRNGVDLVKYKLWTGTRVGLMFLGSSIPHKGLRDARKVAELVGMQLSEFGAGCRHGKIGGEDKLHRLQSHIAVVLPYTIDAGPHVPLEAMACGTPVIGLDRAAMPEYVPEGGGLLGESVEEMAGLILGMEFNPWEVRATVIKNGFSVYNQVNGMQRLLEKVFNGEEW